MVDCAYCGKPCLAKQGLSKNDQHAACVMLKERRYRNRVCVRCGRKGGNRVQCERCRNDPDAPYAGFDGPAGANDVAANGGKNVTADPKSVLDSCRGCGRFTSVLTNGGRLCKDCFC